MNDDSAILDKIIEQQNGAISKNKEILLRLDAEVSNKRSELRGLNSMLAETQNTCNTICATIEDKNKELTNTTAEVDDIEIRLKNTKLEFAKTKTQQTNKRQDLAQDISKNREDLKQTQTDLLSAVGELEKHKNTLDELNKAQRELSDMLKMARGLRVTNEKEKEVSLHQKKEMVALNEDISLKEKEIKRKFKYADETIKNTNNYYMALSNYAKSLRKEEDLKQIKK